MKVKNAKHLDIILIKLNSDNNLVTGQEKFKHLKKKLFTINNKLLLNAIKNYSDYIYIYIHTKK